MARSSGARLRAMDGIGRWRAAGPGTEGRDDVPLAGSSRRPAPVTHPETTTFDSIGVGRAMLSNIGEVASTARRISSRVSLGMSPSTSTV